MNGESVANHVTVNALVLAPVLVDLRAVRSALETILNLNHATNHVNCVKILIFVLTLRFSKILKISVLFDFQESAFCYHCFLKASGNYGKDFLLFLVLVWTSLESFGPRFSGRHFSPSTFLLMFVCINEPPF